MVAPTKPSSSEYRFDPRMISFVISEISAYALRFTRLVG